MKLELFLIQSIVRNMPVQNLDFISDPEVQKKVSIRNGDDAVKVAKKYCRFSSPEISVDLDEFTGVYCVGFIQATQVGGPTVYETGGQTVYVNRDGIVLLNILGE